MLVTDANLEAYCAVVAGLNSDAPTPVKVTFSKGPRYARIILEDRDVLSRRIHTFIDLSNGDILKGSWKAPVKNGVRGNIFRDYAKAITQYGAAYLR